MMDLGKMHVVEAMGTSTQPWCFNLPSANKRDVFLLGEHKYSSSAQSKLWCVAAELLRCCQTLVLVHTFYKGALPLLEELKSVLRECPVIGRNAGCCKYHIVWWWRIFLLPVQ